jgi:hypothetical protein
MRAFRIAASVFGASARAEDAANIAIPTTSQYASRITWNRTGPPEPHNMFFRSCAPVCSHRSSGSLARPPPRAVSTAPAPAVDAARRGVGTGLSVAGWSSAPPDVAFHQLDPSGSILVLSSLRSTCSTPLFAMIFARFA